MQYKIYKLVQPSHLKEIEPYGYYQKTIYRDVLEELDVNGVESSHSSFEEAVSEINKNLEKLKCHELTIIPIFKIDWDGEIK